MITNLVHGGISKMGECTDKQTNKQTNMIMITNLVHGGVSKVGEHTKRAVVVCVKGSVVHHAVVVTLID